ncbi:MAG: HNH endonuclease [Phycisphaeraceae bacterium]|nr:HNH endonuclease [Phycisphaeraceae bacterium]
MAFEFDIHAKRHPSDEEILKGIRKFVRLHKGTVPSFKNYQRWKDRPCSQKTLRKRFGTWRETLIKSGAAVPHLEPIDAADLVRNLERVWRKVGYPPGETMLKRYGRYSGKAYYERWGSIRRACKLLARVYRGTLTREAMIEMGQKAGRRRRREQVRLGLRWQVLERDGFACSICGACAKSRHRAGLHVDHIVPVSRGGTNDASNLRTLCSDCNIGRGAGRERLPRASFGPERGRGV